MTTEQQLNVYELPESEELSADYRVSVNGKNVPVYQTRVSAVPFNQVWPGYQRPLDQTEIASVATWDMEGRVSITVESSSPIRSVIVRPASYGIQPYVSGNRIEFDLPAPGQMTVEVNGRHQALHLFANALEEDEILPDEEGVVYFGPGEHDAGTIELSSDQTLYIAGGAVVYGTVSATDASNIAILGRGILDSSRMERDAAPNPICLAGCSYATIDGITIRDAHKWALKASGCEYLSIYNVKLIGMWRYNSDGIDIVNSCHVSIEGSFIRSFDDSIALKGLKGKDDPLYSDKPIQDVMVHDCVIWCDWGRALEIGAETSAPEISGVVFRNCDIIHTTHVAMDIQHGDRAEIWDILFDDIRVEMNDGLAQPLIQKEEGESFRPSDDEYCPALAVIEIKPNNYSRDDSRGTVQDVYFKNVQVISDRFPSVRVMGHDDEHTVDHVTFDSVTVNDMPLEMGYILSNEFATGISALK